jgi:signal transduction histidine kinase
MVIPAAFAGFILFDLQAGVPVRSIAWFILADTVEVLIAALGLSYFFDGVPRLNSVTALSKYLFFTALLAPSAAAFLSASGIHGGYWPGWRICFLSEVLAFITLAPAILSWVSDGPAWARKSHAHRMELALLIAGLVLLSYFTFIASGSDSPALLYSLVPFLLWAALRFGSMGVSTSVIVVGFLSIWGAVHGRGPFATEQPFSSVLSLQLFLIFAAAPFMVLAALVEERKRGQQELQESEERLRLAVQAGRMYAFEWDTATDVIVRSGRCADAFNWLDDPTHDTGREFAARVHPDDRQMYMTNDARLTVENPTYQISFRIVRPDGSVIWLEDSGHGSFDDQGRLLRTIGMVADITERKLAEEALSSVSRRLIEAQEQERARIARELHDDLSQRMALIQIGVEQLARDSAGLSSKYRQQLYEIANASTEVSSSIHTLSHQLHPYKLDTLGLVASLRGFFGEFAQQHNLRVQFANHDVRTQIPQDVTLCLFRIVQEALRNVVKHSGAAQARVELYGHADRIDLCVSDSGAGFTPGNGKAATGLGLISMGERLRLVKGHLSIESQPTRGTRIRATVPLPTTSTRVTSEGKTTEKYASERHELTPCTLD